MRQAVIRMKIEYAKAAVKALHEMDKPTKSRIKAGIEGLAKIPPEGDIKPMKGVSDGRLRLRIGKYRVVYKYLLDNTLAILYIMDIGSRGDIYK